ncbi:TVP38/TMEM64 family protein [Plectonema cf. radiosum LEGE 06105]|uniref:TVP38/TMEM64 family membrane protein n=1 Tax=Plectonema cf. radiosum LEGE 06105 TaxID=945769 RepID=A0A8J7FCV5_9CYAN|nr:TVP38/TMEM64 family protein [Plectonema radiosum]MBE9216169.1 TVP38/TMEM64 family protein [Plectonema cf. radiosum LEGE 06105]
MKHQHKRFLKLILIGCLIAILIIAAKYFNLQGLLSKSLLWVDSLGWWGPIAFIIIYNVATLLFIPGSLLTLKGGCLFGLCWGSLYVLIAAIIGAIFAFLVGRYISRDWVCQQIGKKPKFQAIDKAVAKNGFKIVFLTRLSPIFPFNLLNYAFGVTQVSLKDYILGSIGMIPGTVMYVYMGSLIGNIAIKNPSIPISPEAQFAQMLLQGVGLIATVFVTIYIAKVAKKALKESTSI